MKSSRKFHLFTILIVVFLSNNVSAQVEESDFSDSFKDMEEFLNDENMVAQNTTAAPEENPQGSSNLSGFAESPWMSEYSQVRETMRNLATSETASEKVEIIAAEKNKYILVKRNGVTYRYNFYQTPINVQRLANHELSEEEFSSQEGLLYQVKIIIPFIDSASIKSKIVARYGQNSQSTVNEKTFQGADIWELQGGYLFQWYEAYKKKAYTRTIDLVSSEMAERIMKEYEDFFDSAEKQVLQKLIVR
ncbi:MAG: hypothetical protein OEZ34_03045 [Spirochaetia bacterium]|nr:hypothetical protein [Spirochaetia bacterium]